MSVLSRLLVVIVSFNAPILAQGQVTHTPFGTMQVEAPAAPSPFLNKVGPDTVAADMPGDPRNAGAAAANAPADAACASSASQAQMACLASVSPIIQSAAGYVALGASALQTMASTGDACSKLSEMMSVAQKALIAYNAACSAMMARCQLSCRVPQDPQNKAGNAIHFKSCSGYALNLASAGASLLSVIHQGKQAKKCKEDSTPNCGKDPSDPRCSMYVNCGDPNQSGNTTCICQRNPRAAGCPGGFGNTDVASQSPVGSSSSDPNANLGGPGGQADEETLAAAGSLAGSGSGLPATASSGSGSGGGMGADGGQAKGQGLKASSLNTNFLTDAGGGGGGGRRGGSGGGIAYSAKYAPYLPGQTKDPNRNIASDFAKQVTGGGGKSNWEKIRERYQENRSSLLAE